MVQPEEVTVDPTNARSRRTRAAILDATRALIEEGGADAVTMGRVAERAGVSRRAVYLHVASRTDLLLDLFSHVSETEGLGASLRRVDHAPDAIAAIEAWAAHVAEFHPRVIGVDAALRQVQDTDPDAAVHMAVVDADQLAACRRLCARLEEEGVLAEGWTVDAAADLVWSLLAPDHLRRLLEDRGWTPDTYRERLAGVLRASLLRR